MRWLDGITDSMAMSLEMVKGREVWRAAVHGVAKSGHDSETEQQQRFIYHSPKKKEKTFAYSGKANTTPTANGADDVKNLHGIYRNGTHKHTAEV